MAIRMGMGRLSPTVIGDRTGVSRQERVQAQSRRPSLR